MRRHRLIILAILMGLSSTASANLVVSGVTLFERYSVLSHSQLAEICSNSSEIGFSSVFGGPHKWQSENPRAGLLHAQVQGIPGIRSQTKGVVTQIFTGAKGKLDEINRAQAVAATSKMRSGQTASLRAQTEQALESSEKKLNAEIAFVINQSIADTHKALDADSDLYAKPRGVPRAPTDGVNSADYYRTCVKFWGEGATGFSGGASLRSLDVRAQSAIEPEQSTTPSWLIDDRRKAQATESADAAKARVEARFSVEGESGEADDLTLPESSRPWWENKESTTASMTAPVAGTPSKAGPAADKKWWEDRPQPDRGETPSGAEKKWWQ